MPVSRIKVEYSKISFLWNLLWSFTSRWYLDWRVLTLQRYFANRDRMFVNIQRFWMEMLKREKLAQSWSNEATIKQSKHPLLNLAHQATTFFCLSFSPLSLCFSLVYFSLCLSFFLLVAIFSLSSCRFLSLLSTSLFVFLSFFLSLSFSLVFLSSLLLSCFSLFSTSLFVFLSSLLLSMIFSPLCVLHLSNFLFNFVYLYPFLRLSFCLYLLFFLFFIFPFLHYFLSLCLFNNPTTYLSTHTTKL